MENPDSPTTVAHHHLQAQAIHNRIRAQRDQLLEALEACLPDLQHYVSTHGPGPDARLAAAVAAITAARLP